MSELLKENEAVVEEAPELESVAQLKAELEAVEAQEALLLEKIEEAKQIMIANNFTPKISVVNDKVKEN